MANKRALIPYNMNGQKVTNAGDGTANQDLITLLQAANAYMAKENGPNALFPHGFVKRTDSTLTYNLTNRQLTISGTFTFYHKGVKYTKTAASETVTHTASIGFFCVYYNGATLTVGAVNESWDLLEHVPVAYIYYNNTAATTAWLGPDAIVLEERHGCVMDPATHKELHMHPNMGAYAQSGFAINGTYSVATGTGGLAACSYGIDAGVIGDEDLESSITALVDNAGVGAQYPVFYKIGANAEWRWYNSVLPFAFSATPNPYYNLRTGGSFSLAEITTNNRYMNYYECAVPFHSSGSGTVFKFIWIMGQAIYTSLAAAQGESILSLNLAGFPSAEVVPLRRVTVRRDSTYSTASGRARIEAITTIIGTRLNLTATITMQDHNQLSNRSAANSHPGTAVGYDNTTSGATATDTQAALDEAFTQIAAVIGLSDAMVYKGAIDASTNPNYPAADTGHTYKISVAGKIGGASGPNVEVGDMIICTVDGTAAGTQAAVGANWNIIQTNIDGLVTSAETSSLDGQLVVFSSTSGKIIKKVTAAINASGFLGVGTTDPVCALDVRGNGSYVAQKLVNTNTAGSILLSLADETGLGTPTWIGYYGRTHATTPYRMEIVNINASGKIAFVMQSTDRLTITAAGVAVVGTMTVGGYDVYHAGNLVDATQTTAGKMSTADKIKLDNMSGSTDIEDRFRKLRCGGLV